MSGLRTAPFRKQNHGKNCWARSSSVRPGKIFADPVCRALDIIEQATQAEVRSLWGLRIVGVQQEAIYSGISASPLFGGGKQVVQSEVESEFDNSDRRIAFPAKSNVLTEGEPSIAIYMLTRGTAALYKMLADGRRQVVGFALPGDFLGSPFSDRYPYSVDAINEVVARQFLRGSFLTFLRAHPNSLCFMLEAAWQENNAARDHMLLLGRGTAEEKFAEFIVVWRARAGRRGALANLVPLPMSRRDIADFPGLTIETVSRVVTKLERENVLRVTSEGLQLMGSTERPLLFERSVRVA
jgi:CRP/FNR family transcriptional regulator